MANAHPMPEHIIRILRALSEAGFAAYAVGGAVRDTLLGREVHDWDVTTSAPAEVTMGLFERTAATGIKYGTVTVLSPQGPVEVTTFRRDGPYLNGRSPESVEFLGSLREDLERRDFTVNAMAMDAQGRVTDLFGGREDLSRRLIRAVGDPERRFEEDALRMFRALRFCAELDFTLDAPTLAAIKSRARLASKLSPERVRGELQRTLDSPRPETALLMVEYALMSQFISNSGEKFPLSDLALLPPGDVRLGVMALRLKTAGFISSAGEFLAALRCTSRLVRDVSEAEGLDLQSLGVPCALAAHSVPSVLMAAGAAGRYDEAAEAAKEHRYVSIADLELRGADLKNMGFKGPGIGRALSRLSSMATRGEVENTRGALLLAASEFPLE